MPYAPPLPLEQSVNAPIEVAALLANPLRGSEGDHTGGWGEPIAAIYHTHYTMRASQTTPIYKAKEDDDNVDDIWRYGAARGAGAGARAIGEPRHQQQQEEEEEQQQLIIQIVTHATSQLVPLAKAVQKR